MQALHAPAAVAELGGKPVEQLGMRHGAAHDAEIAGGLCEAAAKMPLPEPVGNDPAGERIFGAGEPGGEVRAAQGTAGQASSGTLGDAGKGKRDFKAGAAVV